MRFLSKENETELHLFPAHRYLCCECPHCDREYQDWCDEECSCVRCDPKQQDHSFTNYCCLDCSMDIFKDNLEIYTKCKCNKENLYHKKRKRKHKELRKDILKEEKATSQKQFSEKRDIDEYTNKSRDQRFKALRFLYDRM